VAVVEEDAGPLQFLSEAFRTSNYQKTECYCMLATTFQHAVLCIESLHSLPLLRPKLPVHVKDVQA